MKKPTGYIVYNGPSMLDGSPIVAILTMESTNPKTGNMAQLWILRADMAPTEAVKVGADGAICGDCKHRRSNGGACYVTIHQAPLAVFKAYMRGNYPNVRKAGLPSLGAGMDIRLGAYGDPAALPEWVVAGLCADANGWTGYTHQWRVPAFAWLRDYCMASADTVGEAAAARLGGWRYFRIQAEVAALGTREFSCPASDEGGNRTDCKTCQACNGAASGAQKASPVIVVHGAMASRFIKIAA